MDRKNKKQALGKGLGSLLGSDAVAAVETESKQESAAESGVQYLKITQVEPNRDQPRKNFSEEAIGSLAESIKQNGMIQPIVVREYKNGYQIIAGERRWRAARKAGLDTVPVIVVEADDRQVTELALIENLQREDLNSVEEAEGYKMLQERYNLRQEEIAERVGKSRSAVANMLRLLNLSVPVREMLAQGEISSGHARALLTLSEETQIRIAERVRDEGLSVRQVETLVAKIIKTEPEDIVKPVEVNYLEILQTELSDRMGRRVTIHSGRKKGKIEIEYYGNDDLDEIVSFLKYMAGKENGNK